MAHCQVQPEQQLGIGHNRLQTGAVKLKVGQLQSRPMERSKVKASRRQHLSNDRRLLRAPHLRKRFVVHAKSARDAAQQIGTNVAVDRRHLLVGMHENARRHVAHVLDEARPFGGPEFVVVCRISLIYI